MIRVIATGDKNIDVTQNRTQNPLGRKFGNWIQKKTPPKVCKVYDDDDVMSTYYFQPFLISCPTKV